MKTRKNSGAAALGGFTLIELLVVIAIIGILASMILPALATAKVKAHVGKARTEIANIGAAMSAYHTDYGRYPSSPQTRKSLDVEQNPDFTFGTYYRDESGSQTLMVNKKGQPLPQVANSRTKGNYQTSNAEVMAILFNWSQFPNGQYTVNKRDPQNPKDFKFLNAKMTSDARAAGIGPDGVYRDPFGNPYIITVDLNADDKCLDAFYRNEISRESPGSPRGINGLVLGHAGWEARTPFMVWSFGPDGIIGDGKANAGPNKDNILSWK